MAIVRVVIAFGSLVHLLRVAPAQVYSNYWVLFTGFVGINVLRSAFTGFCPLATMLKAIGIKPGQAFN